MNTPPVTADAVPDERAADAPAPSRRADLVRILPSYAMIGALVVVVVVAQILYPGFLDWANIKILLSQNAPLGIIAVGMTFVMIAGGFDLSVGAIYAFGATLYALVAKDHSLLFAGACALGLGLVCGLVNGILVSRLRINAFIATLGTASVFGGLAFIASGSEPQIPTNPGFSTLGQGSWGPLPISVWLLIAVVVVGGAILARTVWGRSLYAVGGNQDAARLSGMRVDLLRTSTFVLVGGLAALGGMITASQLVVGQADIGASIPLDAIAVVVIGGTSLFGGEGAMWRTVVGLLILGSLTNLFQSLALDSNVQSVAKGLIVLGAVGLDVWVRSRR
jgi:ribose transport system permease protein